MTNLSCKCNQLHNRYACALTTRPQSARCRIWMDRFVTPTSLMISSSSSATAVTSPSYPAHSPRIT